LAKGRMNMPKTLTYRSKEGVGLGWKPDIPDHRDYIFADKMKMKRTASLPQIVDLFDQQSPVRNQGNEGSCVGHGVSSGVDFLRRSETRTDPSHRARSTIYSPRWVYRKAREIEGQGSELVDDGAYIRDGVKAVATVGICTEGAWQYKAGEYAKAPPAKAKTSAKAWTLGQYMRCDTLDAVLNALAAGHPVVFGFMCHTGMWTSEVDRTGVFPMPSSSDQEDGGHCVLGTGYDRSRRLIAIKNSWSAKWGSFMDHPGYGALPFDFFERGLADDAWAMVAEA
jgi:hypothetical protein